MDLKDILVEINENLLLIPGDSGDGIFKYSDEFILDRFYEQIQQLDGLDYIIIDTGAGIGENVQTFVDAADYVVVVTTAEPAAITDAYAMLKIISEKKENVFMIMNQVKNRKEAETIFTKLIKVAEKNMANHANIILLGAINKDTGIEKCVRSRTLFVKECTTITPTEQLHDIANVLLAKMERKVLNKK